MSRSRPAIAIASLAAALATGGCKSDNEASSSTPSATATASASAERALEPHAETGIAECDAYFQAAEACFEKADDDLKAQLRESIARYDNQLEHADSDVAKQAVGVGCGAALDSLTEEQACE